MSQHEYDQAPATLKVREFEAGGKILVTTFWTRTTPRGAQGLVSTALARGA